MACARRRTRVYALVQTVLVQDEALKRANDRIQELEGGARRRTDQQSGGFLDSMRDAIFGQGSHAAARLGAERPRRRRGRAGRSGTAAR